MTICNKIFQPICSNITENLNQNNFTPRDIAKTTQHIFAPNTGFNAEEDEIQDAIGVDSTRSPQPGRCYEFNGVDDYISIPNHSSLNLNDEFTICFYVDDTKAATNSCYLAKWNSATNQREFMILDEFNLLSVSFSSDGTGLTSSWRYNSIRGGGLKHIAICFNNGVLTTYVDGVEQATSSTFGTLPNSIHNGTADLTIGAPTNNTSYSMRGNLGDIRIFNRELSESEILDIIDEHKIITNNLVANYKCDESSGATAYDSSGNAHHGTINNANLTTFHSTNINIPFSYQNEFGYTDNSGVLIPRDESNISKDAAGNNLQYSGRVKYNIKLVESNCANFDGVDDYLSIPELTGTETVTSSEGTATPTISAGRIDFTAGTCWKLKLDNGSYYVFSEGKGTNIYDVSGNDYHATATNITEVDFWAESQDNLHWNISKGFRHISEIKIPALENFLSAADGNAVTNPAGTWHNDAETKLQQHDSPEMRSSDSSNFWFNGSTINKKSAADFSQNLDDKIFTNVSNSKKLRDIITLSEAASTSEKDQLLDYTGS